MIQILLRYNWTWVALIGSDNAYGIEGMRSLSQQAPHHGICIAYQGVIPELRPETVQNMRSIVQGILTTKVTTIVAFASKSNVHDFFPYVLERNMTDKVWIGTEDWSASSLVSRIPGIRSIGTVIGVAIKYAAISGYEHFERKVYEAALQHSGSQDAEPDCVQSTDLYSLARMDFPLEKYDITSSFNIYQGVYAMAHALHHALDCDSGECQRRMVEPWEVKRIEPKGK